MRTPKPWTEIGRLRQSLKLVDIEGVAQVDRDGCALILSEHRPEKVGKGLMFISLNVEQETKEAYVAALDNLRAEFEGRAFTTGC